MTRKDDVSRMLELVPGGHGQAPGPAVAAEVPQDAVVPADPGSSPPIADPPEAAVQETQAPKNPVARVLDDFLSTLVKLDSDAFFWEPVQEKDAPRYFDVVKHPMDIQTMREKVSQPGDTVLSCPPGISSLLSPAWTQQVLRAVPAVRPCSDGCEQLLFGTMQPAPACSPPDPTMHAVQVHAGTYLSWLAFVADFELMCSNAMVYNQKRSRVHKTAVTMLRQGKKQLQVIEADGQKAILALNPNATALAAPLGTGPATAATSACAPPAAAAGTGVQVPAGLQKPPPKPPLKPPQKAGLRSPPKPQMPKKVAPPKKSRLAGHLLSGELAARALQQLQCASKTSYLPDVSTADDAA